MGIFIRIHYDVEKSSLLVRGKILSLHQRTNADSTRRNEFTVPLEDIAIVVVESRETVITPSIALGIRFIRDYFIEL